MQDNLGKVKDFEDKEAFNLVQKYLLRVGRALISVQMLGLPLWYSKGLWKQWEEKKNIQVMKKNEQMVTPWKIKTIIE